MWLSEIQTRLTSDVISFIPEYKFDVCSTPCVKDHLPLNSVLIVNYFSLYQSSVAESVGALYLCVLRELQKSLLTYSLYSFTLKRYWYFYKLRSLAPNNSEEKGIKPLNDKVSPH